MERRVRSKKARVIAQIANPRVAQDKGKGLHPYQLTQQANLAVTELDQDGPEPKQPAEQSGNRLRLRQ